MNRRYCIRHWVRITAAAGLLLATAIGLVIEVATGPHPKPDYSLPPVPAPPWAPDRHPAANGRCHRTCADRAAAGHSGPVSD